MNTKPLHLHITATPKRFKERKVVNALEEMHKLCQLARLGQCMNGPHWASMTPKKWKILIFFASTDDLLDYQQTLRGYGYLKKLEKYCKGGSDGIEIMTR